MSLKLDGIGASAGAGVDEGVRRAETPIVGPRDLGDNAALRAHTCGVSYSHRLFHKTSSLHIPFLAPRPTMGTLS